MKKSSLFPRCARFSIVPLLFLTLTVFTGTAHASTFVKANKTTSPVVGTWHVAVYFLSGTYAGKTANQDITFASDGTLSSIAISPSGATLIGSGAWSQLNDSAFTYSITENVSAGIIHVTVYAVFTDQANGFTGWAHLIVNAPDGTLLDEATAILTAQRA